MFGYYVSVEYESVFDFLFFIGWPALLHQYLRYLGNNLS